MKYAVAHMDFYNNDLKIIIVEANSPIEALFKGIRQLLTVDKDTDDWLDTLSKNEDIEIIKQEFFNGDQLVAVELIN